MKILMLNYEYPPLGGGAAPVTQEMAEKYAEKGHEVDVVTMHYGELPRKEEVNDNLTIYRVPSLRSSKSSCSPIEMLSFLPTGLWKARKLVKNKEYDINHTHFIIPTGILSYLLEKIYDLPYLVTAHGSDVPKYNPDRFGLMHKFTKPIWKRVVKNSKKIVSPSKYLKDLITNALPESDVKVIPNGFDYTQYNPDREKEERILITSRHFKRKGIQHALEALAKAETNWEIVITGEGQYTQQLKNKANRLNLDVDFPGWIERDKLEDLLETSSIYIFPSSHENCPVSLQEAMASGNAIIASNKSGTAEVIGNAGITLNPENTRKLAGKIAELTVNNETRNELLTNATYRIKEEYNWDRISKRYEKELKTK